MFFLHILILYHLLEEVIFTLYYLYTTTKIVIKKADFEKLLNKTYAAGYQDGLKEPRPAQVWMTSKRGFDTEPKVLSI